MAASRATIGLVVAVVVTGLPAACTPSLDWRLTRPEGLFVEALFPCRPELHSRTIAFRGAPTRVDMLSCSAGGITFALTSLEVVDPGATSAALSELRTTAMANIDGTEVSSLPADVPGMTPNPAALRVAWRGRLPGNGEVSEHTLLFVRALRLYQASVIGSQPPQEAVDTFFAGLKLPA